MNSLTMCCRNHATIEALNIQFMVIDCVSHQSANYVKYNSPNFIGSVVYRNLSDVFWEAISTRQVLSLYQGLETKNLQSFIAQFVYFYGYSYFKRLYLETSGSKSIGTRANLILAAAAGACTAIVTQVSRLCKVLPIFT